MKRRFFIILVLVGILLMAGAYTFAQPTNAEATLSVARGQAVVFHARSLPSLGSNGPSRLNAGDVLAVSQGDRIEVAAASTAVLTMPDGSSAELAADTTVELSELVSTQSAFRARFTLMTGRMVNRVQRLTGTGDAYEVRTPSSTASVRGTLFSVDVLAADSTLVSVDEGVVAVAMDGQEVLVTAGYEVTAVRGQPLSVQPQSRQTQPVGQESGAPASSTAVETSTAAQTDALETAVSNDAAPANTTSNVSHTPVTPATAPSDARANPPRATAAQPVGANDPTVQPRTSATAAALPPTATRTLPTYTAVPATATRASPTYTAVPATATLAPLPTNTPEPPPSATLAPLPSATLAPPSATLAPPSATLAPPSATLAPPSATPEPAKVTLCHKGNTIEVDPSAVQAHLDHGDTLGPCP